MKKLFLCTQKTFNVKNKHVGDYIAKNMVYPVLCRSPYYRTCNPIEHMWHQSKVTAEILPRFYVQVF